MRPFFCIAITIFAALAGPPYTSAAPLNDAVSRWASLSFDLCLRSLLKESEVFVAHLERDSSYDGHGGIGAEAYRDPEYGITVIINSQPEYAERACLVIFQTADGSSSFYIKKPFMEAFDQRVSELTYKRVLKDDGLCVWGGIPTSAGESIRHAM